MIKIEIRENLLFYNFCWTKHDRSAKRLYMALSAIAIASSLARHHLISSLTTSSHFPPSSLKLSIRVKRIPVNKHTRHIYCKRMASTSPAVNKITAPYGSWKSPITADVVSGSTKRLGGFAADSLSHLIWLESRPTESG